MATPVVQRMLKSQEWWHVAEDAESGKAKKKPTTTVKEDPAVKEARLTDNIYHHMMLRLGDQELAKLQAETKAANAAEQELRAQRDAAVSVVASSTCCFFRMFTSCSSLLYSKSSLMRLLSSPAALINFPIN